jgi:transcriptional regulator with XRE-family HTH domain
MTAATQGPIAGRRRLSTVLRRAREELGYTQEQVAAAMDWSLSKIIRIEKGSVGVSTSDLRSLLNHYGVSQPDEVQRLIELARISRARPWWAPFREQLPSHSFETLLGLESAASSIDIFHISVIPGLFQTDAYIEAFGENAQRALLSEEAARVRAEVRRHRQKEVFTSDNQQRFTALLDEATLRRVAAGPTVMREQLAHLIDLAVRPNFSIRIIPFTAGPYVDSGSFMVLSFPDDTDPAVVYVENAWFDAILESEQEVDYYRRLFAALEEKALGEDASIDLIRRVAAEFS